MSHKGAAVLVGVNGLLALGAIDKQLLQGLLQKAIRLEGSGTALGTLQLIYLVLINMNVVRVLAAAP